MGWVKYIKADKPISDDDIRTVVVALPKELKGFSIEQDWGWSCGADISKSKGNEFSISGSYGISGAISERFTETVVNHLKELGYTLTVEESS